MRLDLPLEEARFAALDLETTGFSPSSHKIVEIGIVEFSLSNKEISKFETLLYPRRSIPADIVEIHGITDDMVRESPTFEMIYPDVLKIIEGVDFVIAHNSTFDFRFLKEESQGAFAYLPKLCMIDSKNLAKRVFSNLGSYSLERLCARFNLEHGKHRAYGDACSARDVFLLCFEAIEPALNGRRIGDLRAAFASLGLIVS